MFSQWCQRVLVRVFFFQLFSTAIEQKKIWEGEYPNSAILVTCLLIGLIEAKIKEGQPLGLTCTSLQDVYDLFSDNPLPQLLFASVEKNREGQVPYNDFRMLKDRSSKDPQQVELIVVAESHTVEIWMGKNGRCGRINDKNDTN